MLSRLKILSLTTALTFVPGMALAQSAEAKPDDSAEKKGVVEEIVVTGSRIRRKDLTTPAPVTVLSREQVQASGKVSIGDFLQSLPEQGNAINAQYNNGGDGSTSVSLRSLGSARTLVLVNGRRMVAGGGTSTVNSGVDLYSIPASAVERIEILKDGASAVYGSDAVAGVVNIITRRGWSGTEASAFLGTSSHNDGKIVDLYASTGTSSDRGSILFNVGYYTMSPVWAGDRSWSEAIHAFDYSTGTVLPPSGSSAIPAGRFRLDPASCNGVVSAANPTGVSTAKCVALFTAYGAGARNFYVDPTNANGGGARPYVGATDPYNFEPANYLYTPNQRVSAYATGDTSVGSAARAYFEASYVNRQSNQKLAPEPLFTLNNGVAVSAQSYYNPYGVDIPDVRRRLVEFGGGHRVFTQDFDTFRAVTGLDGTLSDTFGPLKGWFWDASFNYGRTGGISTTNGTLRVPYIAAAVGPSFLDPADSTVKCGTPGNVIANCVPLNLFGGAGSITPAQAAGLGFYGADTSVVQMSAFQLNASGELVKLMADRPVGLAVGAEFRNHSGSFQPNPITGAGENTGNNYLGTRGSYNTSEAYAELSVPVVSGMVGVENLEATLAGRFFHYSNFGSDSTYKFGVRYSPIREVTLRGTYSTAFRAPGISDLYLGVSDNFPTLSDPCSTDPGTGTLRTLDPTSGLYTQCNTTGVTQGANAGATANNGDDRTQIKSHNGGNANLKPEKAKVFTFGVVTEPVKNLSVTLDYYNIKVTNAISTIGAGLIADSCFTASPNPGTPGTASTPQKYCNLIHRVPIGQINYIDDLNQNIGGTAVAGLDLAARYDLPTEVGRFNFIFDGTYLLTYDTTQADGSVDHGAGNYDFLLANPKVKFNTGVRYGLGGLGAGLSLKYVGTYKECDTGFCSVNAVSNPSPVSRTVKAWTPIDAFVSYALPSSYGRTSLAVGMNNVFDQNPPFVYNNGTYPSDPSTYDFLGRYMYLRLTHSY